MEKYIIQIIFCRNYKTYTNFLNRIDRDKKFFSRRKKISTLIYSDNIIDAMKLTKDEVREYIDYQIENIKNDRSFEGINTVFINVFNVSKNDMINMSNNMIKLELSIPNMED